MNQELKEKLHYYLPHGLIIRITNHHLQSAIKMHDAELNSISYDTFMHPAYYEEFKPHMRPLSALTKEIIIPDYNDGKPFVPIKVLGWLHWSLTERGLTAALINISGWEKLFQWHFWIGNQALFDTGEIIRIEG